MKLSHSRRAFLKSALAVGALPLLPARLARADAPARNLVLVFHPNGLERGWEPAAGPLERLGSVLAPFAGLEPKMTVLSGLKGGIQSEPFAHSEGMPSLWTGSRGNGETTVATNASIDQRVAARFAGTTAFDSIQLGVQSVEGAITNTNVTSYDELGRPQPPEDDPVAAFRRIFGGSDPVARATERRRRGSLLSYLRGSVERVRDLYGSEEATYLDAHLESIRGMETRVERLDSLGGCGGSPPMRREALYDPSAFGELADLQADIAVSALACGATRVVNYQLAHSTTSVRIPGVNPTIGMHQVMHERTPEEKRAINRFFVEKVARLVRQLEERPGTGGSGTLLDETLVVWGTEMSIGNHGNHPIPFVLFGATGVLATGRTLGFGAARRPRHSRLLETIAPLLGLPALGRFGTWSDDESTGVLEELLR